MSERAAAAVAARPTAAPPAVRPAPVRPAQPEPAPLVMAGDGFAGLHCGTVIDADTQRRRMTQRLLEQLAPALGLDPARLTIEVHAAAGARLDAAGAHGLQEGATVWLHPSHYAPEHEAGRYLLAHEATHAAQRSLPAPRPAAANPRAAETEADAAGRAFAAGRLPQRPRIALVAPAAAADAGAKDLATAPPVVDVDMVRVSRSREIAAIRASLGGLWVSDGDVFDVLEILDRIPFPVVHPVLMALDAKERYWLADNLNPPHVYRFRKLVLACFHETLDDRHLRDAIDLKVLRALPPAGLDTQETESARWLLQHLADDQRREVLASENGPALRRIIAAPAPSAAEQARLRREADQAAFDEGRLAEQRRAIAAMADDEDAKTLFGTVKTLLSPRTVDGRSDQPNGADAREALDRLARAAADDARLHYVAERMQEAGLIDVLLRLLPAGSHFDTAAHASTLLTLVQSRLPIENEKLIQDLLSYGLFDWAVRDHEALFAYKLIRLLPLADQYRFRLRDGGKWYLRLLDNLPDDPDTKQAHPGIEIRKAESRDEIERLRALGATEVDEQNLYYNASQVFEKKRLQAGVQQAIDDLVAAFEEADRGVFRDAEAEDLFRRVVALGGASLAPGHEKPADDLLRATVVHELDRLGWIDKLFDKLPDAFLFAEPHRIATVKIMLARDAGRVTAMARTLVSRGFTDWMVSDGEAWLAYQCVKALPADERETFLREQPELWSRITGEMSASMRQSRDLNLYIGDAAGTDRAGVLGQLADAKTWTAENAALLGDLLRMAVAMTEHRFAFERSQEFDAVSVPALAPLVDRYRLWDPARRPVYKAELLQGTHWYEEGVFASLASLWGGLVTLATMDVLFVDRRAGVKVDLEHAQDYFGGDLFGARLDTRRPGPGGPGKAPPPHPDRNRLTLLVDPLHGKSAHLELPELKIASTNVQLGGSTLQTGELTLSGLVLDAAFDQPDMAQPARAEARFDRLDASDLLLAKSQRMLTITRLVVSALRLAAGTMDTVAPGAGGPRGIAIPFPLLVVPMLALFALLALPVFLYRKIASLVDQGLESATGEHFAADIAERTKSISFTLASLDVDSLTTSGGQHIGHASVREVGVRVGLNKATRLEAESRSLAQRIRTLEGQPAAAEALDALRKRRAEVDAAHAALEQDELEYVRLMKELRSGSPSTARQQDIQKRLDALKFEQGGGAFIDIGAIELAGVSGTLTAREPIRLDHIHGEGGGAALSQFVALPTAGDAELSRRSDAGERPGPSLAAGQDGGFVLDLGNIHTGELRIGGALRSVDDIDRQLAGLDPRRAELAPLIEALKTLRVKAERHALMVQHGVSQLDARQLAEYRQLRTDLAAQAALVVQQLDIVHARLDADVATGRLGFSAESLRAAGIDAPARGLHVDEIIGRGLGVSAIPTGGLLAWTDPGRALKDAEGHIDGLEVRGARSDYQGLLFEKATLTGAYARLGERGNQLEAGLAQFAIDRIGIAPRIGLMRQRLAGLREKARLAADANGRSALDAEITALEGRIGELQALVDARLAAAVALQTASTPAEVEQAKQALGEADSHIVIGLAQYGASHVQLDDFGVKATGAGDVISDVLQGGPDPLALISRGGVSVQGTGPGKQLFSRFVVRGGEGSTVPAGEQDPVRLAQLGEFEIGPTRLDLSARRHGDTILVDVPSFEIDAIALDRFEYTASESEGGLQVWSDGRSGLSGISFSGSVQLQSRVKDSRDLADFRIARVHVEKARIDDIHGQGLGIALLDRRIEARITSGAIHGVHVDGFDVEFPDDPQASPRLTGQAGIDSIDKLVLGRSVAGAWQLGGGRIDARQIGVQFLQDGGVKASLGSLSLSSFAVRGPDGWLRFNLADLGARFTLRGNRIEIEDFHFARFEVPAVHWKIGHGGFIEADQPVVLTGMHVKASATTEQVPSKTTPGEQETRLAEATIDELRIDRIGAEHLVYQDEDHRIELGPPPAGAPAYMKGFKPLSLEDLSVSGLRWDRNLGGMVAGTAGMKHYEVSAQVTGLKDAMKVGAALKGDRMSAKVTGPGLFNVDVGKVEKVRGTYADDKLSTRFGTGAITGAIEIGPDFIGARDVDIGGVMAASVVFDDAPARSIHLKNVFAEKVRLGHLRRNTEVSKDPADKGKRVMTSMEIENLEFFDVWANGFVYDGESHGKTPDGKDTSSTQHVVAEHASIDHILVEKLKYDAAKAETVVSARVDQDDPKASWSPLRINGLAATLVNRVGSEETKTKLVTNVQGGPLQATDLKLRTVKLGVDAAGKPVTRSAIDGAFQLTRLGLINPDLTVTDAKGNVTRLSPDEYGSIELTGLNPRFLPNGSALVSLDALTAKNLLLTRGGMKVKIPFAELREIALGMKGMGTDQGIQMLAARAKALSAKGLTITIDVDRSIDHSDAGFAKRKKAYEEALKSPGHALIAEPLSGMSGDAEVEPEHVNLLGPANLPWDPNLTLPIRGGKINFYHVHPYAVNIRKGHLTLGDFGPEVDIGPDLPPNLPGVHGSAGEHGMIDLRELLEGLYAAPPTEPKQDDQPSDLSGLRNLNFGLPSLRLGSGRMGLDLSDDKTLGPGDVYLDLDRQSSGQNVVTIPWQHVGDRIDLDLPHLHAKEAGLPSFAGMGPGKTGAIDVMNLHVGIAGLANLKFTITIHLKETKVDGVEFGDVSFLDAKDPARLKALPDPTAKEVNPDAQPQETRK